MYCVCIISGDMQPGEGDWVTGSRAMFVLGALCAVAGSVCAILFVLMEFKIISLAVLICAVAASESNKLKYFG